MADFVGFVAMLSVAASVAGLAVWGSRVQRRALERLCREAAERLGLRCVAPGRGFFRGSMPVMSGTLDGLRVTAEEYRSDKQSGLRVTVEASSPGAAEIPEGLGLEREHPAIGLLGLEDVVVGDPAFDEQVRVRGGAVAALVALGAAARREIRATLGSGDELKVAGGVAVVETPLEGGAGALAARIARAARAAAHLLVPGWGEDPGRASREALARRANEDPEPGVRLRALEALRELESESEPVRALARRLLADPHPEVRLRAAAELGEEGFEVLATQVRSEPERGADEGTGRLWWELDLGRERRYELAERLDRTRAGHERRRARALGQLVAGFPPDRVRPLLREALEHGSGPLRLAALRGAVSAGDPSFESVLLTLLDGGTDDERAAAVQALGVVGTAAAVPRLRELAAHSGALGFPLRRAVDGAVAAIRSRLDGAAAGQVSLAGEFRGGGGGEVSLAGGEGDVGGRLAEAVGGSVSTVSLESGA